jgi:hypothetical protein
MASQHSKLRAERLHARMSSGMLSEDGASKVIP